MTHAPRKALEAVKAAILEADPEIVTDTLWMPERLSKNETVVDYIDAALTASAPKGEQTKPFAYVIPGDDNARDNGFIDAMVWPEGEFTKPLYTSPPPAAGWDDILDEIIQATKRHSLDVGFNHSAPTTKELQARLDAVEQIALSAPRREAPAPSGVKIIDPINSVGVKGARKQAAETHASMISRSDAGGGVREVLADWSDLPKDIYVIGAQRVDAVGYDVQCCSVPMVTAPEVRYVRADMIAALSTPSDAGNESAEAITNPQTGEQSQ